jgi:hypothetical protein
MRIEFVAIEFGITAKDGIGTSGAPHLERSDQLLFTKPGLGSVRTVEESRIIGKESVDLCLRSFFP